MIDQPTTLEAILRAKEERVLKQKALLNRFSLTSLLSLSLNIPSSIKLSHEAVVVHEIAHQRIVSMLKEEGIELVFCESNSAPTGAESLFVCKEKAEVLKALTCQLEQGHPLGRLMDIDVLDSAGILLSRTTLNLPKRQCFMCEEEAHRCARAQKHAYPELLLHIKVLIEEHAFAESIALWCERAMKTEVELTPKPGLVDKNNSGAHDDMTIHTFYASIEAIKPFVINFVHEAQNNSSEEATQSFKRLREIGVACEKAMFKATKGINTHKGMIFCLALICGAIGRLKGNNQTITRQRVQIQIQALCHNLVENDLVHMKPDSAGARFFYECGSAGIREVAQSGFAIVFEQSLPFFEACREEEGEEMALKRTLLLLISLLDDSTLWSRGGHKGLHYAKTKAHELFDVKGDIKIFDTFLKQFDVDMTLKNLSPGGSADLLAMTWLVSRVVNS